MESIRPCFPLAQSCDNLPTNATPPGQPHERYYTDRLEHFFRGSEATDFGRVRVRGVDAYWTKYLPYSSV